MVKDFKRWTTQLAATVLYNGRGAANLLGADMTWKNVCLPGVNCGYCRYAEAGCPWGLTQHTLTGFTLPLGWRVWGLLILCALFLGRMICGWLCPFGWAQELLDKLPMLKLSKN
ncbi:4Fe-4S binding protein, partial [Phascolarctobacterium faecium]